MGASMWGAYPNSCRICAVSILENAFNNIIFLAATMGVAIELGSRSPAHQGGGLHFELMQRVSRFKLVRCHHPEIVIA